MSKETRSFLVPTPPEEHLLYPIGVAFKALVNYCEVVGILRYEGCHCVPFPEFSDLQLGAKLCDWL